MPVPERAVRREETPVDDVRRVREKLSADFGNDVEKLAQYAHQVAEEYRERLGVKRVKPVDGESHRTA